MPVLTFIAIASQLCALVGRCAKLHFIFSALMGQKESKAPDPSSDARPPSAAHWPAITATADQRAAFLSSVKQTGITTSLFARLWQQHSSSPQRCCITRASARSFLKHIAEAAGVQVTAQAYDLALADAPSTLLLHSSSLISLHSV